MITVLGTRLTVKIFALICCGLVLLLMFVAWFIYWLKNLSSFSYFEQIEINKSIAKMTDKRKTAITAAKRRNRAKNLADFFQKLRIFPRTKYDSEMAQDLLIKLEVKDSDGNPKTADELYVQSCLIASGLALIFFLIGFIFPGLRAGMVLAVIGYKAPVKYLQIQHAAAIEEITEQMPKFISMFYYRFKDETQMLDLQSLILDFLPLANPSMRRMLLQLNTDLNSMNDVDALQQLEDRYSESTYVYQFVNTAIGMWKKQPNAYVQLRNLYHELRLIRKTSYADNLKHQMVLCENAFNAIFVLFGIEMMIFILFQIGDL